MINLLSLAARLERAMAADYAERSTKDRPLYGSDTLVQDGAVWVRRVIGWRLDGGWQPELRWDELSPEEAHAALLRLETKREKPPA